MRWINRDIIDETLREGIKEGLNRAERVFLRHCQLAPVFLGKYESLVAVRNKYQFNPFL